METTYIKVITIVQPDTSVASNSTGATPRANNFWRTTLQTTQRSTV